MTGLLGLLASAIGPVTALLILLCRTRARDLGLAICVSAAFGFGLGISSLVWWLLDQLPIGSAASLKFIDAGIWITVVVVLAALLPRRPRVPLTEAQPRRITSGVIATLAVLLPIGALAVASFASLSFIWPHGDWDAWAMWNGRARVLFLTLPTPGADPITRPVLAHADYPELLQRSIARAWTLAGAEDVSVPMALAAMFAVAVVLLGAASIRRYSTTTLGLVTAAFILASPRFVTWAPAQGADIPLSFYMLLTFVFAAAAMTTKVASLWVFAGLSAGLAAWTKNEGIAFVMVVGVLTTVWAWRAATGTRRWIAPAAFATGAAPALLVLIAFKLNVPVANDIVAGQSLERTVGLFTWDRLSMIGEALGRELWYGGATTLGILPVLAFFVAVNGAPGRRMPAARVTLVALAMMLAAYALVYVLTPNDLKWHLGSSVDRLILQLMPSTVWAGMLVAGRRSEAPGIGISASAAGQTRSLNRT